MDYKFILLIIAIVIVIVFGQSPDSSNLPSNAQPKNNAVSRISLVDNNARNARRFNSGTKFTRINNGRSAKGSIVYTLGRRSGDDRIIATDSDSGKWGSQKDLEVLIEYPARGYGDIVTYVAIVVDQNSNEGDAYVVRGGIGQRQISFVIEAKNTDYIKYDVFIYGRP